MCAAAALSSHSAFAQLAGQVGVASENDFRGNTLSAGNPVATVALAFDEPHGWFAGGFLSEARFRDYSHDVAQIVLDAGYAHALSSSLSWEVGATSSVFPNATSNNYGEFFAGVASRRWSSRVYLSPNYYGRGHRTVYGEFNYFHPLNERVRLLAHVGAQRADNVRATAHANTFDSRVGVDLRLGDFSLQIQHADTDRLSYALPIRAARSEHRWVVSVTHPW
jgi:uncharacterized protein (TIGR02001 family)